MSTDTKLTEYLKLKKNPNLAVLDFLKNADSLAEKLVKQEVERITSELITEVKEKLNRIVEEIETSTPKICEEIAENIKEHTMASPEKFKGDDGKDYILTDDDKQEIASKITVPVVKQIIEKREVIRELPSITNQIKEVAKYEEPTEIASKLNTLDEKVKMSVIDGLEKKFELLKQTIQNIKRGSGGTGGGGMGNTQHETFAISAGTTSITTAYPIAGSGNAIFSFTYENARLEMTNHYTVGANRKTITFHADIQAQFINNTVAAITYARG